METFHMPVSHGLPVQYSQSAWPPCPSMLHRLRHELRAVVTADVLRRTPLQNQHFQKPHHLASCYRHRHLYPQTSRVNSSNTVSIFNLAPFSSRSRMKSYDQTLFGFCARVRSARGSRLRLVLLLFFTTCSSSRRRTLCTRFRFTRHPSARSKCVIIRYPWRACRWLNAWIRLSNRTVIRLNVPFR